MLSTALSQSTMVSNILYPVARVVLEDNNRTSSRYNNTGPKVGLTWRRSALLLGFLLPRWSLRRITSVGLSVVVVVRMEPLEVLSRPFMNGCAPFTLILRICSCELIPGTLKACFCRHGRDFCKIVRQV